MQITTDEQFIVFCRAKTSIYANFKTLDAVYSFINSENKKQIICIAEFLRADLRSGPNCDLLQTIDKLYERLREYETMSPNVCHLHSYMHHDLKNNKYKFLLLKYDIFRFDADSDNIQTFFG